MVFKYIDTSTFATHYVVFHDSDEVRTYGPVLISDIKTLARYALLNEWVKF